MVESVGLWTVYSTDIGQLFLTLITNHSSNLLQTFDKTYYDLHPPDVLTIQEKISLMLLILVEATSKMELVYKSIIEKSNLLLTKST